MKRWKVVLTAVVVLAAVIATVAWLGRNSNMLKDMDASEVEKITFVNSFDNVTLTEQSDIQLLFIELKAMKFQRIQNYHKYGTALLIDLKLKTGEILSMSILTDDIIVNGLHYRPKKDYCANIQSIMDTLTQK